MSDPWAFGWTQILTIAGFLITIGIAISGFRTFGRWKKEKIEEKRIETAIDALAMSYESKFIFDHIRGAMAYSHEWKDMESRANETDAQKTARGPFFATLRRIEANKDFFDRAWKLQVKCAAIFGPEMEDLFLLLQKARREIEVSAGMLLQDPHPQNNTEENRELWNTLRAAVWEAYGKLAKDGDVVGQKLTNFRLGIERKCRPIVDREFKIETPNVFARLNGAPVVLEVRTEQQTTSQT